MDAQQLFIRIMGAKLCIVLFCNTVLFFFSTQIYSQTQQQTATSYYYLDQYGNPVFTDKAPTENKDYKSKPIQPLKTTNWKNVPTPKLKNSTKKPSKKKPKKPKVSECTALKNNIHSIEARLKLKLEVTEFDQLKIKLTKLRWKRQTTC